MGDFSRCHDVTAKWEGGYVNDKYDPGGETKFGISKRAYPHLDIANLTYDQAKAIYRRDYWTPVKGDLLEPGVDLVVYDAGVNSGPSRGVKWLQQAINDVSPEMRKIVAVDGAMGPATLGAASRAAGPSLIVAACARRRAMLTGLKTWARFGKGWSNRLADIEAKGVRWVTEAKGRPARDVLAKERDRAKTQAADRRGQSAGAATGGASAGGLSTTDLTGLPDNLLIGAAVLLAAVALIQWWRSREDEDRAKAYLREAIEAK